MDSITGTSRAVQAREIVAVLAEFWPSCFIVYEQRRRPLKVGIRTDLAKAAAGALTPAEITLALHFYTGNLYYLRACHAGADRIDLDGQVVGKVTAHEAANAAAKLARARQKILARKVGDPADATTSNKADTKTSNKTDADIEPSPPSEVVALPNRRLTLADLRLLAQARKAAS